MRRQFQFFWADAQLMTSRGPDLVLFCGALILPASAALRDTNAATGIFMDNYANERWTRDDGVTLERLPLLPIVAFIAR